MDDNTSSKKTSGIILWFTGLSGAGKTTVAEGIFAIFREKTSLHVLLMEIGLGKRPIPI